MSLRYAWLHWCGFLNEGRFTPDNEVCNGCWQTSLPDEIEEFELKPVAR